MEEQVQESLVKIGLLSDLADKERRNVEKSCSWKHYRSQEQIIDRHSESSDVFFMVTGKVRVVNYSLSGREITFDDVGDGRYFGELPYLCGH